MEAESSKSNDYQELQKIIEKIIMENITLIEEKHDLAHKYTE